MLCVAKAHLQGWPEGQAREVNPDDEDIQGKLRAHYIEPLTRRSETEPPGAPLIPAPPAQVAVGGPGADTADEPEPPKKKRA